MEEISSESEFYKIILTYLEETKPELILLKKESLDGAVRSLWAKHVNHEAKDFERWLKKRKGKQEKLKQVKEEEYELTEVGKSFFLFEDKMYEQTFDGENCRYCVYDFVKKTIDYCDSVAVGQNNIYQPIDDEEVIKGYVQLPSQPEEYYSDELLDQEIKAFVNKWLDIPEQDVEIGILTTKKSWVYQRFNTLNYLRVLGDFGAGKSRYLDVFSAIHYKSLKTTGTVTPAALFRIMNKWEGTVAIDEADRKETDETDEVLKIINQGYESENPVWRCDPNDPTKIEFHNVYGPKILSSRKPFTDKATESRCFTTVLRSTLRKDIPPNRNDSFKQESLRIRNKLLMWRFKNYWSIDPEAGSKVDLGVIDPRLRQISVGFVSMFINEPERLERFRLTLKDREKELIDERSQSWEGRIFKAIVESVAKPDGHLIGLTSEDIVKQAELLDQKSGTLVNGRAISKYMKSLGFGLPKLERDWKGVSRKYYFDLAVLADMAPRYLSEPELIERICNSVTVVTQHVEGPLIVTNPEKILDGENSSQIPRSPYVSLQPLHRYNKILTIDKLRELFKNQKGNVLPIEYVQSKIPGIDDEWIKDAKEKGDIQENPSGYIGLL